MSEKAFWHTLRKNMKKHGGWLQATRHEDKLQSGIADVSFVSLRGNHGWLELKKVNRWPVRENTIVRIPHYHESQRIFLTEKGKAGGNCWLLVKVANDVLLFDYEQSNEVGRLTKNQMFTQATKFWKGRLNYKELGGALSNA